jgi:dTDP-4-amino-4,6-dideoxygalactose transaminase
MSQIRLKRKNFLTFGSPLIATDEIKEVVSTLESGWLGTGPKVKKFEDDFKSYKDSKFAIAVNSCTAALHLSMVALGLKPGDEVITTPLTFCSTVNSIIHAGATPVLADVDFDTMNIDPKKIEQKITNKTKCILPVHFAGLPCEMSEIMELAKNYNLKIIEDCAHSIESHYNQRKLGTLGDLGCFSFYVTKNVVTGEGGMVVTDNEKLANKIKRLALHGMNKDAWKRFSDSGFQHYYVEEAGFKYNMMDIQAALGIHQLIKVEKNLIKRNKIWNLYKDEFSHLPITLPKEPNNNSRHGRHLFTILINEDAKIKRDEFLQKMQQENIGVGVHYLSIPEHPFYKRTFGWNAQDYPNAMKIGRATVSLPLSPNLDKDDLKDIVNAVKKILS